MLSVEVLRNRSIGVAFAGVLLLYPPLQGVNWFDFHLQSFLPLFFFSTLYFLHRQNWKYYFVFVVLSLMVEEHAAMTIFFIGMLAFVQHRKHILSALKTKRIWDAILLVSVTTLVLSAVWYLMTIWIRDAFFPVSPAFLSTFKASSNWSVLGATEPLMIPFYVIRYPDKALLALGYDSLLKAEYLTALFVPFAFMSFLKIEYLLPTLPWFVYSLFSNYRYYYIIYDQYPAYVLPFIVAAAIYALNNRHMFSMSRMRKALAIIVLCTAVTCVFQSPLSPYAFFVSEGGVPTITRHEQMINEVLTWIPANASVITQNNLFPHVSSRINAYAIPSPIYADKKPESREFTNKTLDEVEYALVDAGTDEFSSSVIISLMNERVDFNVEVTGDGIILYRKGFEGNETILTP
jgi:uncharacterized membrane protein